MINNDVDRQLTKEERLEWSISFIEDEIEDLKRELEIKKQELLELQKNEKNLSNENLDNLEVHPKLTKRRYIDI